MPLWLWIVIVVAAVLGLLYLSLLPARRARRGLAATAVDPHTIAARQSGPNTGPGPA
jgi:hypothetical protein